MHIAIFFPLKSTHSYISSQKQTTLINLSARRYSYKLNKLTAPPPFCYYEFMMTAGWNWSKIIPLMNISCCTVRQEPQVIHVNSPILKDTIFREEMVIFQDSSPENEPLLCNWDTNLISYFLLEL